MKWTWDKFGIHVTRTDGDPIPMERNPHVILDCLQLTNATRVRVDFYDSIGRAIVTVDATDHGVTLENTRRASRQSGWDVEVFTTASLDQIKVAAVRDFTSIKAISPELTQALIDGGHFTFDDLSIIDPDALMQLGGFDMETVNAIIEQAEIRAEQMDA